MATPLSLDWRVQACRGVLALVFGVLACLLPHVTLHTLVFSFGAFAVLDGSFSAVGALDAGSRVRQRWPDALSSAVAVGCGVSALVAPPADMAGVAIFIGSWATLAGIVYLLVAIRMPQHVAGEVLLAQAGAVSLAFGIVALRFSDVTAARFAVIVGSYCFFLGCIFLSTAGRLRQTGSPEVT